MKRTPYLTLLLGCALTLAGCDENTDLDQDTEMVNIEWVLQSIEVPGTTPIDIDSKKVYSIHFTEDYQFSGIADCNEYYGTYTISDTDSLSIVPLGITYKGCGESIHEEYYYILQFIHSYQTNNNTLLLYYGENNSILNYIRDI